MTKPYLGSLMFPTELSLWITPAEYTWGAQLQVQLDVHGFVDPKSNNGFYGLQVMMKSRQTQLSFVELPASARLNAAMQYQLADSPFADKAETQP